MRRALGVLVLLAGCITASGSQSLEGLDATVRALVPVPSQEERIGIEYASSPFGRASDATRYAALGLRAVKMTDWNWQIAEPYTVIQPEKPAWCRIWASGPFCNVYIEPYQWGSWDAEVKAWQAAGYSDIHVVIRAKHNRFTSPTVPPDPVLGALSTVCSAPPIDQAQYGRFVRAVVERYDGDGVNDMPGLRWPIRWYEPESEQQSTLFWCGTAEEYVETVRTVRSAALAAHPETRIVLGGTNFDDMLDDDPSLETIDWRLHATEEEGGKPEPWRSMRLRAFEFHRITLQHLDLFDAAELHTLTSWTGVEPALRLMNHTFDEYAGRRIPLWIGDATGTPVTLYNSALSWNPPITPEQMQFRFNVLNSPSHPRHKEMMDLLRVEQAQNGAKKVGVAIGEGAEKIMMGLLEDWPWFTGFPFNGLVDTDGSPRPIYYAMRLLDKMLGSVVSAESSRVDGAVMYTYRRSDGSVVMMVWRDAGAQAVTISLPTTSRVRVTAVPTTRSDAVPATVAVDQSLVIKVGPTPIFIEPL